jgi:hypothetical protein
MRNGNFIGQGINRPARLFARMNALQLRIQRKRRVNT